MALARAARAALALMVASSAAPAAAQIARRAVALYPLSRADGSDAADVQALLDAAVHRAAQRSDDVAVAEPIVLRAACGAAASATPQCLGNLAGAGLVLRATVHRSEASLVIALEAIDGGGRTFGPVTSSVDAFIQSAEPLAHAVVLLVDQVISADRRRAQQAGAPAAGARPAAVAARPATAGGPGGEAAPKPDLRIPEPPPPRPAAPAPAKAALPPAITPTVASAPRVPGAWMRTAGPLLTITGCAALAGGAAVSVMNRSLARDLDRKFEAGALTPADLPSYDRVKKYNQLSALLFASGGAVTLGGLAVWTAAPSRGAAVAGVSGRF